MTELVPPCPPSSPALHWTPPSYCLSCLHEAAPPFATGPATMASACRVSRLSGARSWRRRGLASFPESEAGPGTRYCPFGSHAPQTPGATHMLPEGRAPLPQPEDLALPACRTSHSSQVSPSFSDLVSPGWFLNPGISQPQGPWFGRSGVSQESRLENDSPLLR